MPRSPAEYTRREWMRWRPLVDAYKHYRHQTKVAYRVRQPVRGGDLAGAIARIRGANVILTVAYNAPQKIDLQAALLATFVPGAVYVVLDNSDDDRRAAEIQVIARAHDVAYVRLPPNAWNGRDVAAALALAMNWGWRHLILPGEPKAFGFIDHDLYPVRPTDPFAPLQAYPIAGRVWHRLSRWQLWAGYCFFRFDAVRHTRLDFGRDFLAALDTGGRNWWRLYRYLDAAKVSDPGIRAEALLPAHSIDECAVEWLGDWLHESHHRNSRRDLQSEKERAVRKLLLALDPLLVQRLRQPPAVVCPAIGQL